MTVRVVSGPAAIATPADVPGDHAANDTRIAAIIAAVQASIDGPTGWLGRSLGVQTLEMTTDGFKWFLRLPYEPVTSITSIKYRDADGVEQTVDAANYRLASGNRVQFAADYVFPATQCASDAVTITYEAGYAANDVPASAKQAVVIGAQQVKAMSDQSVFLQRETVEGVGSMTYAATTEASEIVKSATELLLGPLRVYWL